MPKLKVPSLQHLVRNWRRTPQDVKSELVRLVLNAPPFNYDPLFGAVRDMLVFGQPYEEIVKGMYHAIKRENVRENFLEALPLIRGHFDGVRPAFVQTVKRRYYPVGRELMVPFEPPLIYGLGGQIYFPWFIFWRSNPIANERLSLFVTLVEEVLLQDPDLEDAKFEILDFSVPAGDDSRKLMVIDAKDVPRVSEEAKAEMLAIFAEGFFLAEAELVGMVAKPRKDQPEEKKDAGDQSDLFDRD